ncbi:hypothetical protein BV25DRAFT_1911204 [Artomyces pyxidatus]|uniref:Uncharacterized protein n=1 Tax=Artomyces pyxidatus TaxID=48021 RepID=A0ACB8TIF7_9AGAM|nr:hypothetical protein BV25DRAFT_1911204 [Artomyces pyxidatus]
MEPPPLRSEDNTAADQARLHIQQRKHAVSRISSVPNLLRHRKDADKDAEPQKNARRFSIGGFRKPGESSPDVQPLVIDLDDSSMAVNDLDQDRDVYRWAVVYENQRGLVAIPSSANRRMHPDFWYGYRVTLFSTAYYSPLSLLPNDPPPFTIPEADGKRSKQPQVSLDEYPLPDGTWRWVSKSWMVDMRNDGQVQYDGFEYNWFFRRHHWRAQVGTASAGGWVRRRRWVRLMMRPAQNVKDVSQWTNLNSATPATISQASSQIASAIDMGLDFDERDVWKGDEGDWRRCHLLMKRMNRDGKKIELWRDWLGIPRRDPQSKQIRKQWTEDECPLPSEIARDELSASWGPIHEQPAKDKISRVVQDHISQLVQLFVYPESRAEFLGLLRESAITVELDRGFLSSLQSVDFWSYAQQLSDVLGDVAE